MNCEKLKNLWLAEETCAFQGWDFSHLDGRWRCEPAETEWDYSAIVMKYLRPADRLLDMGTGGGEFLLSLGHPYQNTAVTEAWAPNIRLCREKLAPLGIAVYPTPKDNPLPIADNTFDIVINRHASYDPSEVRRILKPGGIFITQQVGGENCIDLARRINLEAPTHPAFSLRTELPRFLKGGFSVLDASECFPVLKFFDVGAVVFWARIIEWSFPNFSVEKNFDKLCALEDDLQRNGFLSSIQHRFVIVAQNTK